MSDFSVSSIFPQVVDNKLEVVNPSSLANKIIGLYFSAHWCGPCRGFTPKLAEKYKEIIAAGHDFEVIFVSADEDEEAAQNYFASMPWKMLSYQARDSEEALSRKFGVNGIPCLVLVDSDGSLITAEGREVIMQAEFSKLKTFVEDKEAEEKRQQAEVEALKASFNPEKFFSTRNLLSKTGDVLPADHLKGKLVGIYFSAHWCGPCRRFTPKLAEKYNELIAAGKPFEVVFVSSDRDDDAAKQYFSEMPWVMLSFSDRASKKLLSDLFDVRGIPTLVLANESGVITDEGRSAIMSMPFDQLPNYAEEQRKQKEKLDAEMVTMPESVTIPQHEHALKKLPSVYAGSYGCDICGNNGNAWVYHCDQCGWDAHPHCAVKSD